MAKLIFDATKVADIPAFQKLCPFGAIEYKDGKLSASAACKMCKLCVKKGPAGAAVFEEDKKQTVDKSLWKGICVYVDHESGNIHPVTLELLGKARELADKIGHPVYCLYMGTDIKESAKELLHYGVDKVFVYESESLRHYRTEPYTAVFEDFINKEKPCAILVGATTVGRQLAPRVAARFKTGLTADCTILEMDENTDLQQIRPAFGGNIMAQIHTPNNRPQLATVRYKIMQAPERNEKASGEIVLCEIDESKLGSAIEVLSVKAKEKAKSIENAEVLVVAGRGVKTKEDLAMIEELASLLGGEIAITRPLAEAGFADAKRQIGLSGRTVRPKLIITCGVSGAIQFTVGMSQSDCIFAINTDEKAPIFKVANYGIVGNLYEVVPSLIKQLKEVKQ